MKFEDEFQFLGGIKQMGFEASVPEADCHTITLSIFTCREKKELLS